MKRLARREPGGDPFEKAPHESLMYFRCYGDNIWLFVPMQQELQQFMETIPQKRPRF